MVMPIEQKCPKCGGRFFGSDAIGDNCTRCVMEEIDSEVTKYLKSRKKEGEKNMKRALQAILIAGEKMKEDVLSGKKKITIREGYRDYTKGPVLIGCHLLDWATMKNIISVTYKTLDDVTSKEYEADGFKSKGSMFLGLRKFYPDIEWNSPVTVIEWE